MFFSFFRVCVERVSLQHVNRTAAQPDRRDLNDVTCWSSRLLTASAHTKVGDFDAFSRTDVSAVTHGAVPVEAKQVGRTSARNYSRSDVTAITHN